MTRTRALDWLERGLTVLRAGGESALTIERLCTDLRRTKGAFYHHFRDVDAYLTALLAFWEGKQTTVPIEQANAVAPAQRRRALETVVHALDQKLGLAVRARGLRDARARAFVARVDRRRIAYLEELADPTIPRRLRRTLARLEYVAFLGTQQLLVSFSAPEAREIRRGLHVALATLAEREARPSPLRRDDPTARLVRS